MSDFVLHPKSLDVWVIVGDSAYNLGATGAQLPITARDKAVARGLLDYASARLDATEEIR